MTSTTVGAAARPIGVIALAHVDLSNGGGAGLVGSPPTSRSASRPRSPRCSAVVRRLRRREPRAARRQRAPDRVGRRPGVRVQRRAHRGARRRRPRARAQRHLALIAELASSTSPPEADVERTLFVPAIGASGRL